MAAGLPIICNDLDFVKHVVVDNGIGIAVDFRDHQALARVVDKLAASKHEIIEISRRSRRYFDTNFNWEVVSRDMYARLAASVPVQAMSARADLDFSWVDHGHEMRSLAAEIGDVASPCSEVTRAAYAEIKRLNEIYPAEIMRLNDMHAAEIKRLNDVIGLMGIAIGPARLALRQARRVKRLLMKIALEGGMFKNRK